MGLGCSVVVDIISTTQLGYKPSVVEYPSLFEVVSEEFEDAIKYRTRC